MQPNNNMTKKFLKRLIVRVVNRHQCSGIRGGGTRERWCSSDTLLRFAFGPSCLRGHVERGV